MNPFPFEVITPDKVVFQKEIVSLVAPGTEGFLGVWAHHAPLLARSNGGCLKVRDTNQQESTFQTGPGFLKVTRQKVLLLTKSFSGVPA